MALSFTVEVPVIPHRKDCNDPDIYFEAKDVLDVVDGVATYNLLAYCTECSAAIYLGMHEEAVDAK